MSTLRDILCCQILLKDNSRKFVTLIYTDVVINYTYYYIYGKKHENFMARVKSISLDLMQVVKDYYTQWCIYVKWRP